MKKSISLLLLSLLMIAPGCQKTKEVVNEYNIVPKPNQILPQEGRFELNSKVCLVVPSDAPEVKSIADSLAGQLKLTAGISLKEAESADGKSAICFVVQEGMPKEGYKLSVTPSLITLTASQPNGFFYGVQTLYQLLPPAVYGNQLDKKANWSVPAVEIEDSPRFVHRGLMLDVCRHYVPIDYIYKFIDLLAMNKMNVFHWHLTDDQGWRIEIKKYPKLTEIGSKREKTLVDYYYVNYPQVFDGKEHGGYYTQEQIKDVVAYAASKYINVVPEIEMPGHALAALAAYPELSCDSTQTYKVSPTWGVFEQVFCPSETTFKFFEGVMDEVIELFPSEYIHIGGDECPKTAWKNSAFCQQLIRQLGLKDDTTPSKTDGIKHSKEDKLQSYFVTRMEKYLNGKGRNIIGWDEILEGGLAPNATVMSWRGVEGGMNAAKAGHNAIMTPNPYVYLDYYQEEPEIAPTTIGGYNTLKKTYSYNPVPDDADELAKKHIIGIQGNPVGNMTESVTRTQVGKLMVDNQDRMPRSIPLERQSEGTEFLLGNPFMAHINIRKFLNENSNVISDIQIYRNGSYVTVKADGTSSAINVPVLIKPMEAVFITAKNRVSDITVTLSEDMITQAAGSNVRKASNALSRIYLNARRNNQISSCVVLQSVSAQDGYRSGEDAFLLIESEAKPEVAVYTAADGEALSIQCVHSASRIPVGFFMKSEGRVELSFQTQGNDWDGWRFVDSQTGKRYSLTENITLDDVASGSGRFYLEKED